MLRKNDNILRLIVFSNEKQMWRDNQSKNCCKMKLCNILQQKYWHPINFTKKMIIYQYIIILTRKFKVN